ncbi:MAG: MFS transporter [Thermodesulfobacteriota bacterium]|nr:MFS transporter [Thermodesulfobacteriota bacterium]
MAPRSNQKTLMYYGWHIVAVAFAANFMAVGTGLYAFNAFLEPVCQAREWSRTQVSIALMLGTPCGLLAQLVYGTLILRLGVKRLMVFGAVTAGLAFMLIFRATHLWQFYLLYMLLYVGNGAYGGIVANAAVSNWFVKKRGKALGIATAGMTLSGAVLPFAAMLMIFHMGMEAAAIFIGAAILAVAPLALLVIVNWPEDRGLLPDGEPHDEDSGTTDPFADGLSTGIASPGLPLKPVASMDTGNTRDNDQFHWPLSRLIRTPAFWKLGGAYAMTLIGVVGVMSQMKPRFVDIGFSDTTAMGMMAVAALAGTAGKYIWGLFCDFFPAARVAAAMMAVNAVGLVVALIAHSMAGMVIFVLIFGFAMGGVMSTYPAIVADFFGRRAFPAVYRFMALFLILQMLGFVIAGLSFDLTGSYDAAYAVFILLDVLGVVTVLSVKRPD